MRAAYADTGPSAARPDLWDLGLRQDLAGATAGGTPARRARALGHGAKAYRESGRAAALARAARTGLVFRPSEPGGLRPAGCLRGRGARGRVSGDGRCSPFP